MERVDGSVSVPWFTAISENPPLLEAVLKAAMLDKEALERLEGQSSVVQVAALTQCHLLCNVTWCSHSNMEVLLGTLSAINSFSNDIHT